MNPGNFPSRKEKKRREAQVRQDVRNEMSDADQLKRLDTLFGKGQGAKKERAKLLARMTKG